MASLSMFLAAMLLIVAGAVIMDAYQNVTGLEFITGLFIVMGGIILFAISLNYGRPPDTHALPPVRPARRAAPKTPS